MWNYVFYYISRTWVKAANPAKGWKFEFIISKKNFYSQCNFFYYHFILYVSDLLGIQTWDFHDELKHLQLPENVLVPTQVMTFLLVPWWNMCVVCWEQVFPLRAAFVHWPLLLRKLLAHTRTGIVPRYFFLIIFRSLSHGPIVLGEHSCSDLSMRFDKALKTPVLIPVPNAILTDYQGRQTMLSSSVSYN